MQRSILPKLAWALRDALAIDPRSQDLAAWRWVAAWAPVMAPGALAGLLEQHFFPKWHAVLRHWLAHAPDFDEVTAWFLGWKARTQSYVLQQRPCFPPRQHAMPWHWLAHPLGLDEVTAWFLGWKARSPVLGVAGAALLPPQDSMQCLEPGWHTRLALTRSLPGSWAGS